MALLGVCSMGSIAYFFIDQTVVVLGWVLFTDWVVPNTVSTYTLPK